MMGCITASRIGIMRRWCRRFNSTDGNAASCRVETGGELAKAIEMAKEHKGGPTLIECVIHQDDCSRELITWGHYVAAANARPPVQK
jgi:pyruvate decarboxylase